MEESKANRFSFDNKFIKKILKEEDVHGISSSETNYQSVLDTHEEIINKLSMLEEKIEQIQKEQKMIMRYLHVLVQYFQQQETLKYKTKK